jgi:release factor glutamine methyltransferase
MWMLRLPGVYAPQHDSRLLVAALGRERLPAGARVLDLCTGSGLLAVAAARAGAKEVTAVDISRRAVWTARTNARLRRLPVTVRRGDLGAPVLGQRFDLVLANPPYVPALGAAWARSSRAGLGWDAGWDGRALLDPLCGLLPAMLSSHGVVLLVHSALCGVGRTIRRLRDVGVRARVADRLVVPFGPVMLARASWLEERGYIRPGQREEELVVIRGSTS